MKEIIRFPDKEIGPVLGSPAAYSAVAASILGTVTGIVTVVGHDMAEILISPLIDSGVDMSGLIIKDCNTRATILTYDSQGEKKVFYEKVASSIFFGDIPIEYLKSPVFFICPMDFEVPLETISELKKLNKLMMTDLGGFGGTVSTMHPSTGSRKDKETVKNIVSNFNIVKASIEDCYYLFDDRVLPREAAEVLHKWGAEIVIITLGEKGSIISYCGNILEIPVIRAKVVDTTGAGDVYCAAFISEYLRTKKIYISGLFASAATSILIEKTGGVTLSRMPSDQMVRERLKAYKIC